MKKKIFSAVVLVFALSLACLAAIADLTGSWTGSLPLAQGPFPISYSFKVDGDKLTGAATTDEGSTPIANGKISGTNFSFTVDYNGMEVKHAGKYYGDSVALDVSFNSTQMHTTLKRVAEKK